MEGRKVGVFGEGPWEVGGGSVEEVGVEGTMLDVI